MPLVNYEGGSSDEETEDSKNDIQPTTRRNHPPASTKISSKVIIEDDDDDDYPNEINPSSSSTLLANLPKPQTGSSTNADITSTEFMENELEDIVRGDNKEYAKNIPQLPKPVKRKRDGPVKIFIPTIEQDSDEEDKPKRRQATTNRKCALLNFLPPPAYDEDKPLPSLPAVQTPSANTPQISSNGLFIPYTVNKKQQQQKKVTTQQQIVGPTKTDSDIEDDDDDNQTDFLGLTKSNQIQISSNDVESVLRETFPKARSTVVEQPVLPNPIEQFEDLDDIEQTNNQPVNQQDDDELLRYIPKNERYGEIKTIHIDTMLGDSARLQLLKNTTEERETMKAQAAIHVPKGETKKRSHISYLVAKAQHDDLQLKNMWSEQKLTKRQTQAKYGF